MVELAGTIATSGTYERGAHLFDPHTRRPAARLASASVTGPDLGLADALATALAVAGNDGLQMVAALEGYEALAIGFDATWRWTAQFPFASPPPPPERPASVRRTGAVGLRARLVVRALIVRALIVRAAEGEPRKGVAVLASRTRTLSAHSGAPRKGDRTMSHTALGRRTTAPERRRQR